VGETLALGLESNGVECVYGDQIGGEVPDDIVSAVSDARATRSSPETSTCRTHERLSAIRRRRRIPIAGVRKPTTKNTTFQRSG